MHRQTDEQFYRDGCSIYGMAAWRPADRDETEVLFTAYFAAARLDAAGHPQETFRRSGHLTQIRPVPAGRSTPAGLAIRSDIPWVGPAPLEWWSAETAASETTQWAPNGPAVFFEVGDYDSDGNPEALLATEQGIGLYSQVEPKVRWQHTTDAPTTGVGVIFGADGGPCTIVYGRSDGYLFVLATDGTLQRQTLLAEPIRCLTALRTADGEPIILVGTTSALRCLTAADLTECWRRAGAFQRLEPLRFENHSYVLAAERDGKLCVFDPQGQ
jgi:hypothetical protein